MGFFATLNRKGAAAVDGRSRELPDSLRDLVPPRFEALGEALAAQLDVDAACAVTGRELARDGVDMGGALQGLRTTYVAVLGREPDFAATYALSLAWSDETLAYLHQLSCEDPLTGLASPAHLRARLTEVYRGVEQRDGTTTTSPISSWVLVVVDLPPRDSADHFTGVLHLVQSAETVRLVFPGSETISRLAPQRLALLTRRDDVLGRKAIALRSLLEDVDREGSTVRVWIEGLPSTNAAAGSLLDELART